MKQNCVVGYSSRLYDTLQQVGYQIVPYEPYDGVFKRGDFNRFERDQAKEYLLNVLIGTNDVEEGDDDYVTMLYEAIDDDVLRDLIEQGFLEQLYFAKPNYYVAIERKFNP